MPDFLQQVASAVQGGVYYLSLFACLALPDICGAMESADGQATRQKYEKWFETNLGGAYPGLAEDMYRFRCSLLHQGSSQHPKSSFSRILFIEPGATTNVLHMNVMNDALNIDVTIFCADILRAADSWLRSVRGAEPFESNHKMFLQRYPTGLSPYISGVSVIA